MIQFFKAKFRKTNFTWVFAVTGSLQIKHFFTLDEQAEQQVTCKHGLKSISRLASEQIKHSSSVAVSSPSFSLLLLLPDSLLLK